MIDLGWKSYILAFFIVVFAVFMNYPPPPESPIVYQWRTGGNYFTFKGQEIFYKVDDGVGRGNLVCLHGFPTSSFDFYKLLPKLKKRFKSVIFLDFLGFGFSDKPRHHKYSIMEQADIVEHLIRNLLVNESVNILAHDYGDTVAQELVARANEKSAIINIASVCLMNGGIFPSHHKPRLFQKLLRLPVLGTILSRFGNFHFFSVSLTEVFGPNTQPSRAELNDFWTLVRFKDGYRVLGSLLGYIDDRVQNEDRWVGALRKSDVKIHMIYGELDPVNPPPFAKHYKSIIHNPSIDILEDVSHYPQVEVPNKVIDLYFKFLNKNLA